MAQRPASFARALFNGACSLVVLSFLWLLGGGAIRNYVISLQQGQGAAVAAAAMPGGSGGLANGAAYAPKEYNKVRHAKIVELCPGGECCHQRHLSAHCRSGTERRRQEP